MDGNRLWQQIRWIGGWLLVLVLLAHDGLMASDAHADAHAAPVVQPAVSRQEHHTAHQPIANVATATTSEDGHHPGHPSACGVAGTAVPVSGHQLERADLGEPEGVGNGELNLIVSSWIGCGDEPFWPPGQRRALLQVYRI